MLSMQLCRDLDTAEWYIERIDAECENIRNQTRFVCAAPIRFAFTNGFSDFLYTHLPVRLNASVVSIDNACIKGSELILGEVRIIAQRAHSGLQVAIIRIRNFVGCITDVLSPQSVAQLGRAMGLVTSPDSLLGSPSSASHLVL